MKKILTKNSTAISNQLAMMYINCINFRVVNDSFYGNLDKTATEVKFNDLFVYFKLEMY